jgi:hypothetical protein
LRSRGHMIGGGVNRPRNIANPPGATVMGSRDAKLRAANLQPHQLWKPRKLRRLPSGSMLASEAEGFFCSTFFNWLLSLQIRWVWFAMALIVTQMWVVAASFNAKRAFEAFVTAQPFKTQVTSSSSLEGPCVALFLVAPETGALLQPTPHQRCTPRLASHLAARSYRTPYALCHPRPHRVGPRAQ